MTVAPQRTRPVPDTGHGLISPHGGELIDRTGQRPDDIEQLEAVTLTSRELSDLDMLASGALSPLEGFMSRADYERVVDEMRLSNGLPWALPVCLAVDAPPRGERVALADQSGPVASRSRRPSSTTRNARPTSASGPPTTHIQASPGSTGRSRSTSPAA
jgi:PUA-like domain